MRPTPSTRSIHHGKLRLLGSCAVAAGLMAWAGPARSQGVAGTGQVTLGSASISPPSPGAPANTTEVVVTTNQTIINWTPTDAASSGGTIDFLPAANTLNFYGDGQYTVLNRFIDSGGGSISRQIALNGTVNSFIGAPRGSGNVRGGNIWFYNAGGILIGNGAAINVGSLLLTANDINTTGGLFGAGGEVRFRGISGGTSAVTISQGASITASNDNPGSSYVALVAPRIVQNGVVSTDGSTAYVAAEQADIRINNGLFDINVLVGAQGGNAITHTGTTTGPAHQQSDINDNRVYMVAIPKNDAVTMLVSGQVGYQDAATAQVDPNGAVVLSAGYNVTNGVIDSTPTNNTAANIRVTDTAFLSNTQAHASGEFVGAPQLANGAITVAGDASFLGDASASLTMGTSQTISATGNLTVQSNGANGTPGNANITVNGGQLTIAGAVSILANGAVLADGSSHGGHASLVMNAGTARTGDVLVSADATGGIGSNGDGGGATGGTATVLVSGTAALFANGITAQANATGGGLFMGPSRLTEAVGNGGDATGGTATISATDGGRINANTSVTASANGQGQTGTVQSGSGRGGNATVQITGAGSRFSAAQTQVFARGLGGGYQSFSVTNELKTPDAGDGMGGTAKLILNGDLTTSAVLGDIIISANGAGGSSDGEGSRGGDARGGSATVTATGGVDTNPDSLTISANADGGGGTSPSGTTAATGDAFGGSVTIIAEGGSAIESDGDIDLTAQGSSSSGENHGSSTGGTVTVRAAPDSIISALRGFRTSVTSRNDGNFVAGTNGDSTGGDIDFVADGGIIAARYFSLSSSATNSNSTGDSGPAQAGTINLRVTNNGVIETTDIFSSSSFSADAATGFSLGGANATGGTIQVIADGGTVNLIGNNIMSADGTAGGNLNGSLGNATIGRGGNILIRLLNNISGASVIKFGNVGASTNGYAGGLSEGSSTSTRGGAVSGYAGNITVDIQGGSLTANTAGFSANGFGGRTDNLGGQGFGGTATFTQSGGNVAIGDLTVSANGTGGISYTGGKSGDGSGGTATINFLGGTFTGQTTSVTASGSGGDGTEGNDFVFNPSRVSDGGNGLGGTASINVNGGATVTTQTMTASSGGFGGHGGDFASYNGMIDDAGSGGEGTGGSANINLLQGTLNVVDLTSDASGIGGIGGRYFDASFSSGAGPTGIGIGGNGGIGKGGTATINATSAINASGLVSSHAFGRGGVGGANSIGGHGGDSVGGVAQFVVTSFDAGTLNVTLDASAQGGDGADGADGEGGNGGTAVGGTSRVQLDGPNANVTVDQAIFVNTGRGGNGGSAFLPIGSNPAVGPKGGNGGDGTGGTVEIIANGGTATLDASISGVATFGGDGVGGNGGNGAANIGRSASSKVGGDGGNGGNGSGGAVRFLANGGTISSTGNPVDITVRGTEGSGGAGGLGTTGNGATGAIGFNRGGVVTLESQKSGLASGQIVFGDTHIAANGDIAGRINLLNGSDGAGIRLASLNATTRGTAVTSLPASPSDSGIYIASSNGQIRVDGDATLQSDAAIAFDMLGDGQFVVNGSLDADSGSSISATQRDPISFNPTVLVAGELSLTSERDIISDSDAQFSASGDLTLTAGGDINIGTADARGKLTLISDGGVKALVARAVGDLVIQGGSVEVGFAGSGGSTNLLAAAGDIGFGSIDSGTTTNIKAFGGVFGGDINTGTDLSVTAGGNGQIASLAAGDDIRLSIGGALTVGMMTTDGSGTDDDADGSNIVIAAGATDIDHAEAANDFTANVTSFRTGLNSLITGGDIHINAVNAVDMGNSTAGGLVQVVGQSIRFTALNAGSTVNLNASGTAPGAEGISGSDIVAGSDISLFGNSIAVSNSLQSGGSLVAFASGGPAKINAATTAGNIVVFAAGDLTGGFVSGGNVALQSDAHVIASAVANGGFIDGNGGLSEGTVHVIAAGDATLTDSSAATMFGVSAGQAASLTNASAGEDMLVIAGTTAALTNVTAGDDVVVQADGAITALRVSATGAGSDTRTLDFSASDGAGAPAMFLTNSSAANGADITLTSAAGNIDATTLSAGDDITLTASRGAANVNGATTLGLGVTGGDSSITATSLTGNFTGLNSASDVRLTIQAGTSTLGTIAARRDIIIAANATANGVPGSALTAGRDINLSLAATSTLGNLTATNNIVVAGGGDLTTGNLSAAQDLSVTAGGNGQIASLAAGDDIRLSIGGALTAIDLNATGFGGDNEGDGRNLFITAGGAVTLRDAAAHDSIRVAAQSIDFRSFESLGTLDLTAVQAINGSSISSSGNMALRAGHTLALGSARTQGGANLSLAGGTGITADLVFSTGNTRLTSGAGNIQVNRLTSTGTIFASGGSLTVNDGGGDLVFSTLNSDVGPAHITNSSGDIIVMSGAVAGLATLVTTGTHDINITQLMADRVSLSSDGNMSLTAVSAAAGLFGSARRTLTVNGIVTGDQIDLRSGDITITSTGQIGTPDQTSAINIANSDASSQTFIGGTGTPNGYHLDADEMTRLFGTNIEIFANKVQTVGGASVGSSAPPDLVIDAFTLTAGSATSNLGANGALTLSTPGKARVIGAVSLTGLTDNNRLSIFADDALEVIMGDGSIRLTGSGSDPAGRLFLQSDDIIVATSAAINDVAAASGTDAINARLAQNDGVTIDDGALYASGINVNVVGGFYVQNSGAGTDFEQRRGLTFGSLGLDVTTASPATHIIINGQQLGSNGTVNGLDTIALLTISSGSSQTGSTAGSFDSRSTFNGCLIANVISCSLPKYPEIEAEFPVQDVIQKNDEDGDNGDDAAKRLRRIPRPLIELREINPLPGRPLLDDPVTGAGNDDLWSAPAE